MIAGISVKEARALLRSLRPSSQSKQYWPAVVQELQDNPSDQEGAIQEEQQGEPVSLVEQYKEEVQAKVHVRRPSGRVLFDDNCMSVVDSFQGLASAGKGQFVSPTANGAHLY